MPTFVRLSVGLLLRFAAFALLHALSTCSEQPRVVGVADLHGDFDHTVRLLEGAGLVEAEGDEGEPIIAKDGVPFTRYKGQVKWIGGNVTLVQIGDLVDRGTYARDLYALFSDLRKQAKKAGGRVVNLIGNHDMMNMIQDLRYVSQADFADCGGPKVRAAAFAPTGWIGRQILKQFKAAVVVANTLFVHAGLLPIHAKDGIEALNTAAHDQLLAAATAAIETGDRRGRGQLLQEKGPFWLRRFAMEPERKMCGDVEKTLELVGAKRMVIGHTQVDEGSVRSRCNGRVLMADTIISKNAYPMCWAENARSTAGCEASLSYVEIIDDEAFAVKVPAVAPSMSGKQVTKLPVFNEEL